MIDYRSKINSNLKVHMPVQLAAVSGRSIQNYIFAQVFECMPSGVTYGKVLQHKGKPYDFIFLYTNPAFQKQIGFGVINGQRASDIFSDLCESYSEIFTQQTLLATDVPPGHFNIYIKKLKEWFSIQLFSQKRNHYFVIFDKITKRVVIDRRYDRLLGEQKAILDSHIVGIARIKNRKFIWTNNTFNNLLGYSNNELIGKSTRIFYCSDEDYIKSGKAAYEVLNTGQVYRAELQLVTKDGRFRWFAFHAELLEPYKLDSLVMLIDITQKKEMELKLLAMSEELHDLYDNAPCGYHSLDKDGIFKKINATELAWLGCTREDVIGKMKPTDFYTQEGKELFERTFPQLKKTGHVENLQVQLVPKSGIARQVSVSASIIKDDNGDFLSTRSVMYDITELHKMEEVVRQHAFYDALTHLPNRHLLEDRLGRALSASERNHCYGALLFLDLDNFKPLNDSHGHAIGDLLLIEVAQRLKKCVRDIDTVARFGGDEFVIIISELNSDKAESIKCAMKIAKKIHRSLKRPYQLTQDKEGKSGVCVQHICSASIGISLFVDSIKSQTELLKQADSAMYLAKNSGKNSVFFYTDHKIEG